MKIKYSIDLNKPGRVQNYSAWEVGDRVMLANEVNPSDEEDIENWGIEKNEIYHIGEIMGRREKGNWDIFLKEFPGKNLLNNSFINLDR